MRVVAGERYKRISYQKSLDLFVITLCVGCLFFILLGTRPLLVPDGARYAEIAREMTATGDYITPHLNGVTYLEKPILIYWLVALAIKLGGLNLWSVRSVNGLLGLIGCLSTYLITRKLFGRLHGIFAAMILCTSLLYFSMVHIVNLDLGLTVFVALSLYAFLLSFKSPLQEASALYMYGGCACAGLAVLSKGLVGILFPGLIVCIWLVCHKNLRAVNTIVRHLPYLFILFLLIFLPWHILVGIRNPEFFYAYFVTQHFLRYTTTAIGHAEPIWFFIPILALGFYPWVVFLPQTLAETIAICWHKRKFYRTQSFFLIWTVTIFLFYSFSKSKLSSYILPILPPLAILTACYLVNALEKNKTLGIKWGLCILILISFAISCYVINYAHSHLAQNELLPRTILYLAAGVLFVGNSAALFLMHYGYLLAGTLSIIPTIMLSLLLALSTVPSLDMNTTRPFTNRLKPVLKAEDEVVSYRHYYQDLAFYLARRITVVAWRNEFSLGMQHHDTRQWLIGEKEFWTRWQSKRSLFVVTEDYDYQLMRKKHPNGHFTIISRHGTMVLLTNSPKRAQELALNISA